MSVRKGDVKVTHIDRLVPVKGKDGKLTLKNDAMAALADATKGGPRVKSKVMPTGKKPERE
mgnify:CR=1 FL=1